MLPKKSAAEIASSLYSLKEERLNALSHAIGLVLSIWGIYALSIKTESSIELAVVLIYGISLALMFLSSSLYHNIKRTRLKAILRKLDHVAIYLLIAGTNTPFLLILVNSTLSIIALVIIWLFALVGIVGKLTFGQKYPKLSIITYAVMGWFALFQIYPIYQNIDITGFVLLLLGGICYSAGIPLYLLKSRHYSHALWHVCVALGAACHFFAIYLYIF